MFSIGQVLVSNREFDIGVFDSIGVSGSPLGIGLSGPPLGIRSWDPTAGEGSNFLQKLMRPAGEGSNFLQKLMRPPDMHFDTSRYHSILPDTIRYPDSEWGIRYLESSIHRY